MTGEAGCAHDGKRCCSQNMFPMQLKLSSGLGRGKIIGREIKAGVKEMVVLLLLDW